MGRPHITIFFFSPLFFSLGDFCLRLWFAEGSVICCHDAHEVRVEDEEDDSVEKNDEDVELLLELLIFSGTTPADVDGGLFVEPHEVDYVPNCHSYEGDNDEDARGHQFSSSTHGVISEPCNEERGSDEERDQENQGDGRIPPNN